MSGSAIQTMTPRERCIETLTFGRPDRVPFEPGGPRRSTLAKWREQGLPADADWFEVLCEKIGLDCPRPRTAGQPGVDFRMIPQFEEKVLEHQAGHYVVQDWMGNITEISDEFDVTYIRQAIDFVTRRWLKFPVENRDDFARMKERYAVDAPGRFPADFGERCAKLKDREHLVTVGINGPFWQLREWVGFEPLCMLFLDDPEFIAEMCTFWTEFVSAALAPILRTGVVDKLFICEDMAYKEKPMISPAMTREFLKPSYVRWVNEAKAAGVPLIEVDSDGRIDELIPVWIESGINVCSPLEVAAGCDMPAWRERFGHRIAFRMGVDKRAMAKGGKVVEAELRRLEPVLRDGGFIPGCDHGVPPDIAWPDFIHYGRLLAEMTGWK